MHHVAEAHWHRIFFKGHCLACISYLQFCVQQCMLAVSGECVVTRRSAAAAAPGCSHWLRPQHYLVVALHNYLVPVEVKLHASSCNYRNGMLEQNFSSEEESEEENTILRQHIPM